MITAKQVESEYVGRTIEEIGSIDDYFAIVENGVVVDLVCGTDYQADPGVVHGVLRSYGAEDLRFDEREGVYRRRA